MLTLGEQHRRPLVVADPALCCRAAICEVRRQQYVQTEIRQRTFERHETYPLENDVAPWIGQDLFLDPVTTISGGIPHRYAGMPACTWEVSECVSRFSSEKYV